MIGTTELALWAMRGAGFALLGFSFFSPRRARAVETDEPSQAVGPVVPVVRSFAAVPVVLLDPAAKIARLDPGELRASDESTIALVPGADPTREWDAAVSWSERESHLETEHEAMRDEGTARAPVRTRLFGRIKAVFGSASSSAKDELTLIDRLTMDAVPGVDVIAASTDASNAPVSVVVDETHVFPVDRVNELASFGAFSRPVRAAVDLPELSSAVGSLDVAPAKAPVHSAPAELVVAARDKAALHEDHAEAAMLVDAGGTSSVNSSDLSKSDAEAIVEPEKADALSSHVAENERPTLVAENDDLEDAALQVACEDEPARESVSFMGRIRRMFTRRKSLTDVVATVDDALLLETHVEHEPTFGNHVGLAVDAERVEDAAVIAETYANADGANQLVETTIASGEHGMELAGPALSANPVSSIFGRVRGKRKTRKASNEVKIDSLAIIRDQLETSNAWERTVEEVATAEITAAQIQAADERLAEIAAEQEVTATVTSIAPAWARDYAELGVDLSVSGRILLVERFGMLPDDLLTEHMRYVLTTDDAPLVRAVVLDLIADRRLVELVSFVHDSAEADDVREKTAALVALGSLGEIEMLCASLNCEDLSIVHVALASLARACEPVVLHGYVNAIVGPHRESARDAAALLAA